jgi:O-antigen ligase
LIPITISFLFYKYSRAIKILLLVILGLEFTGIVISYSRMCFFAVIPAVFLTITKFFTRERKILAAIAALFLLLLAAYFFPAAPKYRFWGRVSTVLKADSAEELDRGRMETLRAGWKMMIDHPIFGVGLGGFKGEYFEIASKAEDVELVRGRYGDTRALGAHNVLVEAGAQLGLVGLGLYILVVMLAFKDTREGERVALSRNDDFLRVVAVSLQIFIIVIMLMGMFTQVLTSKIFWMVIPLTSVLRRLSSEKDRTADQFRGM